MQPISILKCTSPAIPIGSDYLQFFDKYTYGDSIAFLDTLKFCGAPYDFRPIKAYKAVVVRTFDDTIPQFFLGMTTKIVQDDLVGVQYKQEHFDRRVCVLKKECDIYAIKSVDPRDDLTPLKRKKRVKILNREIYAERIRESMAQPFSNVHPPRQQKITWKLGPFIPACPLEQQPLKCDPGKITNFEAFAVMASKLPDARLKEDYEAALIAKLRCRYYEGLPIDFNRLETLERAAHTYERELERRGLDVDEDIVSDEDTDSDMYEIAAETESEEGEGFTDFGLDPEEDASSTSSAAGSQPLESFILLIKDKLGTLTLKK